MSILNKVYKNLLIILFSLFLSCFLSAAVYSAEVTLSWAKPADSRVAGYNVYCTISGTNFTPTPEHQINSADQTSCLISDLIPGETYYFAASSFDSNGNESQLSDTSTYTVSGTTKSDSENDQKRVNMAPILLLLSE